MVSNKTCPKCSNTFTTKANLTIHLNRIKPCNQIPGILFVTSKYKCERCCVFFKTNQKLTYHLNRKYPCVIKDPAPEEIELRLLFETLKEEHLRQKQENEHLKVEIDHLKMQPATNTTNNSNNIQNTNIQHNNITINVYGQEDLSHISDAMYKSCFRDFNQSVEKYFGMKHFSKYMQGNHNLYISNMRDGYMMVFNSKKWNLVNREVTMKKMYYAAKESLSNAWDMMCNKNAVEPHILSIYPRFIEYELDDERDEKFQTASCDKMACMAYNNRKFPMQMKKQMEKEL